VWTRLWRIPVVGVRLSTVLDRVQQPARHTTRGYDLRGTLNVSYRTIVECRNTANAVYEQKNVLLASVQKSRDLS